MSETPRGYGRLPNAVARDCRLSDVDLVVLGYRVTYGGTYGLNERHLGTICKPDPRGRTGLGKNGARGAISRLGELGYLSREQPKASGGVYAYAVDHLQFPDCDQDYKRVYREWFDGSWSLQEIATHIFLRAGLVVTSRGGDTITLEWLSAKDLRERFDWSKEKAARAIQSLRARGKIEQKEWRDQGEFGGTRYRSMRVSSASAGDRDTGQRITGQRGDDRHTKESDTHVEANLQVEILPSEDSTQKTLHTLSPCESAVIDLEELESECFRQDELLGWIQEIESSTGAEYAVLRSALCERTQEALDVILVATDFDKLAERLDHAADGRVKPTLRGRRGAYCVAYMAALVADLSQNECDAGNAVNYVLNHIRDLTGARKRRWLNSFKFVGLRLLGSL